MIPHKAQYISGYICTYLALFFIFGFYSTSPEYHILQFHAFFLMYNLILGSRNDIINRMLMEKISAIPKPESGLEFFFLEKLV